MTGLGESVIRDVLLFSSTVIFPSFEPLKLFYVVFPSSIGKVDLESFLCIFIPPELSPFLKTLSSLNDGTLCCYWGATW